jgi:ornithine carbamoyltransferase
MKHFLDLRDLSASDIRTIIDTARRLKLQRGVHEKPLHDKALAMIFEKNSTRTRVSFEVAIRELGGYALVLQKEHLQLGRGETVADTAHVLSRYIHAMMLRAHQHATLMELAQYAEVPVINGLTNLLHPCQVMADLMTIEEHFGTLEGRQLAWVGDGNNMANTFITAAAKCGFSLHLCCPKSLQPDAGILASATQEAASITHAKTPEEAVTRADVVITDTWVSMGDDDTLTRRQAFTGYQVNEALMSRAADGAIFLHCLPAHRGEEVSDAVLDGSQSRVWDEAENRLHVQKAILMWCMGEI